MHKRPKMHDVHRVRPTAPDARPSGMHDVHVGDAQPAFSGHSGMHNTHVRSARCAPGGRTICTPASSGRPHHARPGRRPDSHLLWTYRDEPGPRAATREDWGAARWRPPPIIQSGLASRLSAKNHIRPTGGRRRPYRTGLTRRVLTPAAPETSRGHGQNNQRFL